jgi:hypothetical protein
MWFIMEKVNEQWELADEQLYLTRKEARDAVKQYKLDCSYIGPTKVFHVLVYG